MENKLPKNWIRISINELTDVVSGGTPSTSQSDNFDGDIPWITPADLSGYEEMYVKRGRKNISEKGLRNSSARLLPKGTVLFSSRAPIGYVAIANNQLSTNQGFKSLLPNSAYNSVYAFYYLKYIKEYAESQATGTTFKELSGKKMGELPFLLPPLAEQERIATKLDALLAKVKNSRSRLEKIPVILKDFRRSVIYAAVNGNLTKEWREKNKSVGAQTLIKEISEERKNSYELAMTLFKSGKSKKPKAPKDVTFTPVIKRDEMLPEGWVITRIGDVAECLDYLRKPVNKDERLKRPGAVPYYGANGPVGFINDYLFNEDLVVIVEDETFLGREIPFSYIIRGKAWVNNHAHVMRPLGGIKVEYLNICWSYYNFTPLTSGTTGRRKLTQGALVEAEFSLAPFDEQKEIVLRVEELFHFANSIEARYNKAKAWFDKIPQAILAKAFRGELIPQDENDEPASELLKRIKEETAFIVDGIKEGTTKPKKKKEVTV